MYGQPRVPFDQTDPMQQVGAPATGGAMAGYGGGGDVAPQDPSQIMGGVDPGLQAGFDPTAMQNPDLDPSAGGAQPGGPPSSDQLSNVDLAQLGQPVDLQSPEDQEVAQMEAALDDPATPPQVKQQIMQELDLAARRRLAGMGGSPSGAMGAGGGLGGY